MALTLDWTDIGVVKQFHGAITSRELRDSAENLSSDSRFYQLRYIITDFSDVSACDFSHIELEWYAALRIGMALANRRIRWAYVVGDGYIYRLGQYLISELYSVPDAAVGVFGKSDEAAEWVAPISRKKFISSCGSDHTSMHAAILSMI